MNNFSIISNHFDSNTPHAFRTHNRKCHTVPLMLSVKQEAVNTNFKVIGLTRLRIKPKSTALEADALTTQPSELSIVFGCIVFGEALRISVKNYSKSTKMAIRACPFSNFFRGSMSPDRPRTSLVSQSASNLFCLNI